MVANHLDHGGDGDRENQAHAASAFVDDGCEDGVCQIGVAVAFAAAVDEADAAAIAIEHLVTGKIDGMIIRVGEFGIDEWRGLAMFGGEVASVVGR